MDGLDDTVFSTYTVSYYTRIVDVDPGQNNDADGLDTLYVNNNTVNFGNGITLTRDGYASLPINVDKTYRSQMIAKSIPTAYNYTDHTIQWRVIVNRNRLPMTNAVVTDTLPSGMEMLIDATHPFEILQGSTPVADISAYTIAADGDTSFAVSFGAVPTSDQYAISFYTLLTDEALQTQWDGNKAFTNNARLTADEIPTSINASATANIQNPVISKGRSYVTGSDYIEWSVSINTGKITLHNAAVADALDPGLQMDTASLRLYEVEVNPTSGAALPASSGTLVESGYTVDYPNTGNTNTLTVNLPEGSRSAYRLEFTTFILADDLNFTNEATLTGSTQSPDGGAEAENVVVNNLWSSGGSGSRMLTVLKDDGAGNPVAGSVYQLLNFNKEPIIKSGSPVTETTDADGKAVFTNLPEWIYFVKEVSAPDGFLLNPDAFGGSRLTSDITIPTADQPALGIVSFNKTTHKGLPLSGGEFTLTGTAFDATEVTRTASSVGGVVTFADVPLGTYTIRETNAPAGFYVSDTVLTAVVDYADADKLAVESVVTPDVLANDPIPGEHFGSIGFNKTDGAGEPLAGAEFGLYNSAGDLAQTTVSKNNGTVSFTNVTLGNYTIREIKAPQGYIASTHEITATIEDDGDFIDGGTFVNNTIYGSIRIVKTMQDGTSPLSGAHLALYKEGEATAVAAGVSGADGVIVFADIPYGDYVIRETQAPEGYALSAAEIPVSVKEDGVTVEAGSFVNEMSRGSIHIVKTSDDGITPLSGARFALFKSGDTTALAEVVSGVDGVVVFTNVPYGNYVIRETQAPEGYMLSATEVPVSIKDDGLAVDVGSFVNKMIRGSIRIVKTAQDGITPLSGAHFALFKNSDAIAVAEGVSGSDGVIVFTDIPYGDYVIRETRAPEGYTLSATEVLVSIKDDGLTVDAGSFINTPTADSPKTGDDIMGYFMLALGCMAGIAVVYVINRKIKKIN